MLFDESVEAHFDDITWEWAAKFDLEKDGLVEVGNKFRGRKGCTLVSKHFGSFNVGVRMHWDDDGPDWLIRFPWPGKSVCLEEKVRNEVAVMRFVRRNTSIPVPDIIAHGTASENPTSLGPFILMSWVEGQRLKDLMSIVQELDDDENGSAEECLDPALNDTTLKVLYGALASVLLQLYALDFDRIGSLDFDEDKNSWAIERRPLPRLLNSLVRSAGLDEDCMAHHAHSSSLDYLLHLSDLHFSHLTRQRNSIFDSQDCRQQYTSRQLFKSIIPHFVPMEDNHGPFKLVCDDFGPGNVLFDVKSLSITAVIDWEFCYTAPGHFLACPPTWLTLKYPPHGVEDHGMESFLAQYTPKLDLFIEALREKEEETSSTHGLNSTHEFSDRIRQSFDSRQVWFKYASQNAWSLDFIYWHLLDNYIFGKASISERIAKTSGSEWMHTSREQFVHEKIKQLQEYNKELGIEGKVVYEEEEDDRSPACTNDTMVNKRQTETEEHSHKALGQCLYDWLRDTMSRSSINLPSFSYAGLLIPAIPILSTTLFFLFRRQRRP